MDDVDNMQKLIEPSAPDRRLVDLKETLEKVGLNPIIDEDGSLVLKGGMSEVSFFIIFNGIGFYGESLW